ncbi:MAG: ATP-binding protein [Chloroflexota bacterium]
MLIVQIHHCYRWLINPLEKITVATQQVSDGVFDSTISNDSNDEFGQLANAFNLMIYAIQDREQDLKQANLALEERVSETIAARQEAEKADQVKSAFLASMSHELRTPLNAIINFSKFLKRGISGPINDEQENLLGNIADSGQHLLNLINDVLDMSKIESGSLNLYIEEDIPLEDVIQTAIRYAEPLLDDKPVELVNNLPEKLPLIDGDRKRLLQIFLNILSNACKFTDEGQITIASELKEQAIQIAITDTGAGIAEEDKDHVFSAFKQTETGLRQGGGTGLGMPITLKLTEAHGGQLWFESEKGKGTTFFVELPLDITEVNERTALHV